MTNPNKVVDKLLEAEDLDWEPDPEDPDDHMPEPFSHGDLVRELLRLGFELRKHILGYEGYERKITQGLGFGHWQLNVYGDGHHDWFVNLDWVWKGETVEGYGGAYPAPIKRWTFTFLEIYQIPKMLEQLLALCQNKSRCHANEILRSLRP